MQKTKKTITILFLIVVILLVIAFIFIFKKESTDRVLSMYANILNSPKFTFSMELIDADFKYNVSIAQKEEDINIDMNTGDEHTSTLIVGGHAYFIMHDTQEYYDYSSEDLEENIDGDIIISGLKEASQKEYVTGTEEIYGKKYYYEEFEDISTFMISLKAYEDSTVKTRFYFDGSNIVYIKNTVYDEEENKELLKVNVEYDVKDNLFEIPEDYAEM